MATDEREWTLRAMGWYDDSDDRYSFRQDWSVSAPDPTEQECDEKADVDVVPKARAEAAEQRVEELERHNAFLQRECQDYAGREHEADEEVEGLEAKLATAVEALRHYANKRYPRHEADAGSTATRALSEIEQGDTK